MVYVIAILLFSISVGILSISRDIRYIRRELEISKMMRR